uniref:Uncharacterized protein n=1 Tax=Peronospora matthiolae TaxID=2874970 RepID=A0AAV1TS98_9STRA
MDPPPVPAAEHSGAPVGGSGQMSMILVKRVNSAGTKAVRSLIPSSFSSRFHPLLPAEAESTTRWV